VQEIISFACVYTSRGNVSFLAGFFKICFLHFYGKLCNVPCGGVLLCVKDSNMITLYSSDTVSQVYIGGGPYGGKGTYCDPNIANVQFSLVLYFKTMSTATKYTVILNTFMP
jgi:hypothetical protein